MKKLIAALILTLLAAVGASAQSTTLTGTVTDAGGVAWVSGKFTFTFNGPQNASWPGGAFSRTVTGTLDGTASFSQLLPSTMTIVPGGTAWNLQVCPLTGISQACFNVLGITTGGGTQPVTVTPPALSILAGQLPVAAYADAEIVAPVSLGFIYYQATTATTGTYRQCQGLTGTSCTTWGNISSGGGAGLPCVTTALSLQYNNAGAFGCLLYTYNAGTNTITAAGSAPVFSLHSTATSPLGGFANAVALSAPESGTGVAGFTSSGTAARIFDIGANAIIVGNSGTGRCDFANGGVGTADCASAIYATAQDTPADTVDGQDLVVYQGTVGVNKAALHSVRNAVAYRANGPVNSFGVCCPAPEHPVNTYGVEIMDQDFLATSSAETAGVKIHSQSAPQSGTKFSIKADVGSGAASFGDSATLGAVGSNGVLSLAGTTSGTATFTAPAVAGTVLNPIAISNVITTAPGGLSVPSIASSNDTSTGLSLPGSSILWIMEGGVITFSIGDGGSLQAGSAQAYQFSNAANPHAGAPDTAISRNAAGVVSFDTTTIGNGLGKARPTAYLTSSNCSSSASPAVCAAASAGNVVIASATTTVTVNTTAVTPNSQIFLLADDTLGAKLGVTCNATLATLVGGLAVTARTAGTSFQITSGATPAVNPLCLSYFIVN